MVMRWLNRDPIGVSGGLNLYGFCGNSAVSKYDKDGCAYFAKRRLSSLPWRIEAKDLPIGRVKASIIDGLADWLNVELQHEQLFMGDGTTYGWDKKMDFMPNEQFSNGYVRTDPKTYDDCIMSEALKRVKPTHYQLTWFGANTKYNCQDYADELRRVYHTLENDKDIKCKCKKGSNR